MTTNQPHSAQEYINQLALMLKKNGAKDIEDILVDYQDYFAQSKAKGYSDAEAIHRLPSARELAASYNDSENGTEDAQSRIVKARPSSAQRVTLFGATLVGDVLLLPIIFIALIMLACFGVVGFFLILTGPLLFVPDGMLGQLDIARPTLLQIVPTAFLFIVSGITIIGVCAAICERIYSGYRASIVARRWLLSGKHRDHLKLIPSVSKQFRMMLYKVTAIAGAVTLLILLILISLSWFTEGTINFPSTWNS